MLRTCTAAATGAAVFLATLIATAPTATAATIPITNVDCTSGTNPTYSISASPGDVLDFTATLTSCDEANVGLNLVASSASINATYSSGNTPNTVNTGSFYNVSAFSGTLTTFQVTLGSTNGTAVIELTDVIGGVSTFWNITISSGGGGSSSSTTSGSAPAPVIQQFGMPATGTCDEAQPEGLNWSGVANGGWGVSWAQWVNNGNGGAVCTRTLVYSTTQSKWIVN